MLRVVSITISNPSGLYNLNSNACGSLLIHTVRRWWHVNKCSAQNNLLLRFRRARECRKTHPCKSVTRCSFARHRLVPPSPTLLRCARSGIRWKWLGPASSDSSLWRCTAEWRGGERSSWLRETNPGTTRYVRVLHATVRSEP